MEAYRTAYVYVRDTFAGILRETDISMCRDSYMPDNMKGALENLIEHRIPVLEEYNQGNHKDGSVFF